MGFDGKMASKKICAITTIQATMASFVIESMEHLYDHGYRVTVICSMNEEFSNRYGGKFNCIHMPMNRSVDLFEAIRSIRKYYRLFIDNRFDIVQYATPNASMYASIAAALAHVPIRLYCQWGIRYVGFEGWKRHIFKMLEKLTCALSTHIRPASHKNMAYAVKEKLYSEKKSTVLGDGGTIGVDLTVFDHGKKDDWKDEIQKMYPILKGKIVFGFAGRIVEDKGVNELLSAFKEISADKDDIVLMMIGDKESKTGSVDQKLLDWALHSEKVIFTGFRKDVHKYLGSVDILVLPSYREGFSMVIQQAQSLAIPIITTDIPGPSEVIEAGVTGLLVRKKEKKKLAEAMLQFIEKPQLRSQFGAAGLRRTIRLFSRERMLGLILNDRNNLILHRGNL